MAGLHTSQWVRFFQQAGIPEKAAATYALTFAENRIQLNMLLDLNKEYLRDMGITLMGDVIAILRHARAQHEELARERLLITSVRDKPSVSSKAVEVVPNNPKPTLPAKKTTPAQRMADHFLRESMSVAVAAKPKVPAKESTLQSDSTHLRKVSVPQPEFAVPVKRKCKPTISALETITIEDDTPRKKARRVSPEEEGGYKIKMPSGSTPRSQQILAKSKELARRKTVFQRLGSGTSSSSSPNGTRSPPSASAVSSTTGVSAPSFKVTGLSAVVSKVMHSETAPPARPQPARPQSARPESARPQPASRPQSARPQSSSVFRRLGDKQVSSSTPSVARREASLPYAGILKSPDKATQRIVQKPVEKVTMVADSVETTRTEVRERLGLTKSSSVQFSRREREKRAQESPTAGIKSRLGAAKLSSQRNSSSRDMKVPSVKSSVQSSVRQVPRSSPSIRPDKIKHKSRGVFSRLGSSSAAGC